jgi:hypothetical protein
MKITTQSQNVLMYQAYGERYIMQAMYSIISLINVYNKKLKDISIVIFTDQGNAFDMFKPYCDISTVLFSKDEVKQWTGEKNFILRTKIAVPLDILSHNNVNLLLIDTDTFFTAKIDHIFKQIAKGNLFMHVKEQSLPFLRDNSNSDFAPPQINETTSSGLKISIDENPVMWNSGVVGVSTANVQLLKDVLKLCDQIYLVCPHWLIEQLAYSTVFSATGKLKSSGDSIFHYYHYKAHIDNYMHNIHVDNYTTDELLAKVQHDKIGNKIISEHRYNAIYFGARNTAKYFLRKLLNK